MTMTLSEWAWDELMEGLHARMEQCLELNEREAAERVRSLIKTFESDFGRCIVGGEILEGFRLQATINGQLRLLEIRIVEKDIVVSGINADQRG
jgi:hypothetical protein